MRNTTLWDSFPEYLADKLYWQAALPTIIADGEEMRYAFLKMPDSLCMEDVLSKPWLMALP